MESQVTYNQAVELRAPPGGMCKSIMVTVEIEPADSGCLIYGTQSDGNIGYVDVRGARTDVDLPFAHPEIYVRYLSGMKSIKISTRGYRDKSR